MANKKVRRSFPFGVIIFSLVLIYLTYHLVSYLSKEQVSIYSVGEQVSLAQNPVYTGLIIREEEVVNAASAGYINYYIENGGRCSLSNVVYSIDENGSFNEMLTSGNVTSNLSDENLSELTSDLYEYASGYDGASFSSVYNLKNSLHNKLLGFLNISSSEALKNLGVDEKYFHTYTADHIGIVEYYTDGFETLNYTDVKAEHFDTEAYEKNTLKGGEAVSTDSYAYKIITSENWSIIIPLTEDEAGRFSGQSRLNVIFNETGIEATVGFEEFTGADGAVYGRLYTSRYMIQYADSRYLTLTIDIDAQKGLKIPATSITTKDFYLIPLDYITTGGNTDESGVYTETVTTSGTQAAFVSTEIFYEDENYAYISKDQLTLGGILIKPDSDERYAVSATGGLRGVYCVNKGYCVFKVIEIINEDSDYLYVKSGTKYGIAVHDHIMLNAASAQEGDKIY